MGSETERRWWIGYAATNKEFEVMEELAGLGIDYWHGQRIEFERRGKSRTPKPINYPALPNYVFMRPSPDQFWRIRGVRHLANIIEPLGRLSMFGPSPKRSDNPLPNYKPSEVIGLERFIEAAEKRLADARRVIGNREAIAEYQADDALEIIAGALAGQFATFKRRIERAHDAHPKLVAEMDLMGGKTRVELDPLDVRKAV